MNDCQTYVAKQLAIPRMRVTVKSGLSELSYSDQILQRHTAARRHNTTSIVAAEKGIRAS
jgi:hypothetical protein